jgi:hypothetical protein
MDKLSDYEKGEYDAYAGYKAQADQSEQYYFGYGDEYARQQNENARTEANLEYLYQKYKHIGEAK